MKIKDLFNKVKAANEIGAMFGQHYYITYDEGYRQEYFTDYAAFLKFVKNEFNRPWADVLSKNIELTEDCIDANVFTIRELIKDDAYQLNEYFEAKLIVYKRTY